MRLQALDIGETVHRLLLSEQRGFVLAAVSKAIYLLTDSGELFWLTTAEIPRHPRCVRVPGPLPGVSVNTSFTVNEPGLLTIGLDLHLDCRWASVWSPPTFSAGEVLQLADLLERVRTAVAVLETLPSPAGLGTLLPEILIRVQGNIQKSPLPGAKERKEDVFRCGGGAAVMNVRVVREIAQACLAHDREAVLSRAESLVGLGEGLTPSGDDFVGGLLFCFYWLSHLYEDFRPIVDGADVVSRFSDKTHLISFTILSDLAKGRGVEPLHWWLGCVLTNAPVEMLRHHAAQLVQIGHSSGWDLLSGALTGLLWALT